MMYGIETGVRIPHELPKESSDENDSLEYNQGG